MNETVPLKLPPGVYRPGTRYDAQGRWWDSNLVRWSDNALGPIGGWITYGALQADGPVRGMHAWRAVGGTPVVGLGTSTSLYTVLNDELLNISPADLAPGLEDAGTVTGGYGVGLYGYGNYGTGGPADYEATVWSLDNFGGDLVAVSPVDGRILRWSPAALGSLAVEVGGGAPRVNRGVVVTAERFVVALGANGDGRSVVWSAQEDPNDWDPINTAAGDFQLSDDGEIVHGVRGRGETLIWTDTSLHSMRYIGEPFIYAFQRIATGCGVVSKAATAEADGRHFWMGRRSFFGYTPGGGVQQIPCDVAEFVFNDINAAQISKVFARSYVDAGEVTWHYPSGASLENDRYVTLNTRNGCWYLGRLERTGGIDRGAFPVPLAADAAGVLYKHETGTSYLDTDGVTDLQPYTESGPVEIGERVMNVLRVIPDEGTLGDVQLTLYSSARPAETETTHGPFAVSQPTLTRFSGRLVRLRVDFASGTGRFGTPRLDIRPGGMR